MRAVQKLRNTLLLCRGIWLLLVDFLEKKLRPRNVFICLKLKFDLFCLKKRVVQSKIFHLHEFVLRTTQAQQMSSFHGFDKKNFFLSYLFSVPVKGKEREKATPCQPSSSSSHYLSFHWTLLCSQAEKKLVGQVRQNEITCTFNVMPIFTTRKYLREFQGLLTNPFY